MTLFHFTSPNVNQSPLLIGGVGQSGYTEALVKRFGNHWRKTPVKGVWCLESPGLQFTIVPYGEQWDIAAYEYETIAEFRKAFEEKSHCSNAIYIQTKLSDKYTGVAVIRYMREHGLLS